MEIPGISALYPAARCRPGPGEESVIRADKAAIPGDKTRLLGHVIVPDHVGVQSLLIALHVVTHHDLGFPLVNEDVRRMLEQGFLHRFVQAEAFRRVRLRHRGEGGFIQLRDLPAVEPGHGAGFTIVPGKGAGIGVGIKVVRDPQADRRLMLLRAHPGIDLAAGGG